MARKGADGPRVSYYKKKFFFSIRERILLHLAEYQIYENELEAPDELTQFGIADIVLAGRSTCSKLLQEMEDKGLLYGRRAHVPSGKIRRTVYFLTPRGHIQAKKVHQKVRETRVKVRTPTGELKKLRVVDIPDEVPVHAPLVDVVCHISRGIFDVAAFVDRMKARRERVAYLRFMPRLRHFFDRDLEQQAIAQWLKDRASRILVLHGLPGVGMTTLAGKVVEEVKAEWSVFWYSFHDWSTPRDVAHQIGEFLSRLKRKDLLMYVETHEVLEFSEIFYLMEQNLQGAKALLIFDDYHKAGGRLDGFFEGLKEMLERLEGPKMIVTGQSMPKFYDRGDVKVKKVVAEMPLEGLDQEGAAMLLTLKNIPESEVASVYQKTKGHPLFLELIEGPEVADARDVDRFLEEQLYGRLLDVERRVLSLASVFRRPVHVDALFLDDDADFVVITALSDRDLLRETTPKVFDLHDLIRSFFYDRLTPTKRRRYHSWAAKFYTSRGDPGDLLEAQYHLLEAERREAAAKLAAKHGRTILRAGFQDEFAQVLRRLAEANPEPAVATELRLLEGHMNAQAGAWDDALSVYTGVAEDAEGGGDPRLEAEARRSRGEILLMRGEYEAAEMELQRSLAISAERGDWNAQAEAYYSLGFLRNFTSELMDAYRHFRKGMHCVQRTQNQAITARLLYGFGVNYGQRGNYKKSVSYKMRAMRVLEETRDLHDLAKVHLGLGASYQELGDLNQAMAYYREGAEYARLTGDQRILAYAKQNASGVHMDRDEFEEARKLIEEASVIFDRLGERRKIAWTQLYRGLVDFLRGESEGAAEAWQRGIGELRKLKDVRGVALFSLSLARVHADEGDFGAAEHHLKVAAKAAKEIDNESILKRVTNERTYLESLSQGREGTAVREKASAS